MGLSEEFLGSVTLYFHTFSCEFALFSNLSSTSSERAGAMSLPVNLLVMLNRYVMAGRCQVGSLQVFSRPEAMLASQQAAVA